MTIRLDGDADGAGRVPAGGVYILFLLAPFTIGLTALGGAVWAWKARPGADAVPRAHLGHQLGLFWLGLVLAIPIAFFSLIGEIPILGIPFAVVGWLLGLALAVWWLWRSLTGLLRLSHGRPPKD